MSGEQQEEVECPNPKKEEMPPDAKQVRKNIIEKMIVRTNRRNGLK